MQSAEIRQLFIDYFTSKNHMWMPSAPLVPQGDGSLLFVNAGMVPFKDVFSGHQTSNHAQIASIQKCIRLDGKHNDLDQVGQTPRHHTFFEMMGNFSFGAYGRAEAIELAWTFLTQNMQLSPNHLFVTVHPSDVEARALWKKIAHLSDHKIIDGAHADNFWSMGDVGPCGPCTEIFYHNASPQSNDPHLEIWNIVFMDTWSFEDGKTTPLPHISIDTGMGFERLVSVKQGVFDTFKTDIFQPLLEHVMAHAMPQATHQDKNVRVLADHIRTVSVLLADGIIPNNEGRGYVLRRLMRRMFRCAHKLQLSIEHLIQLQNIYHAQASSIYSELGRAQKLTHTTLELEWSRFAQTLQRAWPFFMQAISRLSSGDVFSGEEAFRLYETYGLPFDVLEESLHEYGLHLDRSGLVECQNAQSAASKKTWNKEINAHEGAAVASSLQNISATKRTADNVYETKAVIQALFANGKVCDFVDAASHEIIMILDTTCFYAESGGQISDMGVLYGNETQNVCAEIHNVTWNQSFIQHHLNIKRGTLSVGQNIRISIDVQHRQNVTHHHSATHLLHRALKNVLGEAVIQKGSWVGADRLRFDFNHEGAISFEQLREIEQQVNAQIRYNAAVNACVMPHQEAIDAGAMALFGEKYAQDVRVISMGQQSYENLHPFSMELCGGTHVKATGDIGFFAITHESAVASGIRRIEAVAGKSAEKFVMQQRNILQSCLAHFKNVTSQNLPQAIDKLTQDHHQACDDQLRLCQNFLLHNFQHQAKKCVIDGVTLSTCEIACDIWPFAVRVLPNFKKHATLQHSDVWIVHCNANTEMRLIALLSSTSSATLNLQKMVKNLQTRFAHLKGGGRMDYVQLHAKDVTPHFYDDVMQNICDFLKTK